jgi:hypothetical protein
MAERRKTVFISYAHQDRKWADELLTHLAPWIREKRVNLWDDSRIKAGDQWHSEIRKALGEGVRSQRDTAERTVEAAKAAVQARATESTKEADVPVVRAHPMYYHALARVVGGHQSWTNLMRDDLIRDVIAPIVTGQLFPVNYDEGRALMNAASVTYLRVFRTPEALGRGNPAEQLSSAAPATEDCTEEIFRRHLPPGHQPRAPHFRLRRASL